MSVLYLHVSYEQYKKVEEQMRAFKETAHRTEGGFYHKSIRMKIDDGLILEVHGPLVGGYGHRNEEIEPVVEKINVWTHTPSEWEPPKEDDLAGYEPGDWDPV